MSKKVNTIGIFISIVCVLLCGEEILRRMIDGYSFKGFIVVILLVGLIFCSQVSGALVQRYKDKYTEDELK